MRHFPREGYFFLKSEQSGLYLSINGEDEVNLEKMTLWQKIKSFADTIKFGIKKAGSKIVTGPKVKWNVRHFSSGTKILIFFLPQNHSTNLGNTPKKNQTEDESQVPLFFFTAKYLMALISNQ